MDCLLHARVQLHELVVDFRVVVNHDLRIPAHRHEDGLDTTANRRHEDLAHLQADHESKGHNDSGKVAVGVVGRLRELQVQVGQQGADVGNEHGAHG